MMQHHALTNDVIHDCCNDHIQKVIFVMNLFNLSKTTEQEWNVQGSGVRIKIANNIDYDINDRPVIERWIEGFC